MEKSTILKVTYICGYARAAAEKNGHPDVLDVIDDLLFITRNYNSELASPTEVDALKSKIKELEKFKPDID